MNEFDKHKKKLEEFLQSIDFIYSGDVISSNEKKIVEKFNHCSFSISLLKKIVTETYDWSIQNMFDKSEEIIIFRNSFTDIHDIMNRLEIDTKIIFYSNNTHRNLYIGNAVSENDQNSYLPEHFNRKFKFISNNVEVSAYFSPLITDNIDDCHFYLVDRPIQSMVWSLQNMEYSINRGFSSNEHVIKSPVYDCDFKVYKIRIVDSQKIREEKINSILNDN
jgi:hypothetical protein